MKRFALLAIPLIAAAGCADTRFGAPPSQTAASVAAAPQPQPLAEVREAQQRLRAIGLYEGPVDGLYGPDTQMAVERFQRGHGLPLTARLDNATREGIRAEAARGGEPIALADPTHVRTVQNRLRQLNFYNGAADGVWGSDTQVALERFQRARNLPVGGVTRSTLAAMGLDANAFRTASAPPSGDRSMALDPAVVRGIQQRLRQLGFYSGAADGVWGPGTQGALTQFQRSRGLEASGTLTPVTASALGLDPNNLSASAANAARR